MDSHHADMDETGEFAMTHKFHYIPKGCDQQGRVIDGVHVQAAEASTEIGADDDQSESADGWLWVFVIATALLSYAIYTL